VCGNQLTTLPETIGGLIRLEELRLGGNRLAILPAAIGELINLKWFNLSSNGLRTLPEELGNLCNLRYFNVHGNPLESNLQKLLNRGAGYLLAFLAMRLAQRHEQRESALPPESYRSVEAMRYDTDFDPDTLLKKRRRKPAGVVDALILEFPRRIRD
jgi:Leucine-rich repeat (LRR) protein